MGTTPFLRSLDEVNIKTADEARQESLVKSIDFMLEFTQAISQAGGDPRSITAVRMKSMTALDLMALMATNSILPRYVKPT